MKEYVIIAPHADDEIIGCYQLLATGKVDKVVFGSQTAYNEAIKSSVLFSYDRVILDLYNFNRNPNEVLLFPDPYHELHPEHRCIGMLGESLLRGGREVIFYSVNMLTPYICEVERAANKQESLNLCYPEKASLWRYENKYFLFEGYTKWIMKW